MHVDVVHQVVAADTVRQVGDLHQQAVALLAGGGGVREGDLQSVDLPLFDVQEVHGGVLRAARVARDHGPRRPGAVRGQHDRVAGAAGAVRGEGAGAGGAALEEQSVAGPEHQGVRGGEGVEGAGEGAGTVHRGGAVDVHGGAGGGGGGRTGGGQEQAGGGQGGRCRSIAEGAQEHEGLPEQEWGRGWGCRGGAGRRGPRGGAASP
ncbi:hypothetical protein GCM10025734_23750 [Kitasatospora paranensis]